MAIALIDMVVNIVWGKQGKGSICVNNIFLKPNLFLDKIKLPLHRRYSISIYSACHYLKENKGSRNLITGLLDFCLRDGPCFIRSNSGCLQTRQDNRTQVLLHLQSRDSNQGWSSKADSPYLGQAWKTAFAEPTLFIRLYLHYSLPV